MTAQLAQMKTEAKRRSKHAKLLFRAVYANRIAEVKYLLRKRVVDLEARDEHGRTFLHANAIKGYSAVTWHLLRAGCKIEAEDADGNSPLHQAIISNNIIVARYLVKAGAYTRVGNNREDPLHLAVTRMKDVGLVTLMIQKNSDVMATADNALESLECAAKTNAEEFYNQLLDSVANIWVVENKDDGHVPLHWCMLQYCCDIKELDIIRSLLERGRDAVTKFNRNPGYTKSPLHYAAMNDWPDFGHKLLRLVLRIVRVDIEHGCSENKTALHYASIKGILENVKLLLEWGADVNAGDWLDHTPMRCAIQDEEESVEEERKIKVVRLLLEYKPDVFSERPRDSYLSSATDEQLSISKAIVEYVAKMEVLLDEEARKRILGEYDQMKMDCNPVLKALYDSCREELKNMRQRKINGSTVFFFNLLADEREVIARYAGNQELVAAFESSDYESSFPIYSATLKTRMEAGFERKKLMENAATVLSDTLKFVPPGHAVIQMILKFLNDRDVHILVEGI